MEYPSFIIKEISIQRMPGFPRGLETYKDLSPYINIIAGPNGSGKSSTARIIQYIIWRHQTDGIQAESSFMIDRDTWEIKIDSRNIILQKNGVNDELTGLPPSEESGRYILALHDLVKGDDNDLAKQIFKESIGGYDLDKAQGSLGYGDIIKNRGAAEFKEYETAERSYKVIEQKQKDLKKDEERLNHLYKTKQEAEDAYKLQDLYKTVVLYLEAKLKFEQISNEFAAFPDILTKVTGEEYTAIENLEEELRIIEGAITESENEKKENEEVILQLNLPDGGVDEKILAELEQRVETLTELERQNKEIETKITACKIKVDQALKGIDENLDSSQWQDIDLEQVKQLDEFLQTAHSIISEKQFLEVEIRGLQKEENSGNLKSDLLTDGIRTLSYWLQEQGGSSGISGRWLLLLSLTAILTVVITYFIGKLGLTGILLIIGMTLYAYRTRNANIKSIREQDYHKTGLEPPAGWNANSVPVKLNELIEALHHAKEQEKIKQKITGYTSELEKNKIRLEQINRKRDEWLQKIKTIPNLPQDDLKNYSGFYWFLVHVIDWQKHDTDARALKQEKEQIASDLKEASTRINQLLTESKVEEASDGIIANTLFKKLKADEDIRKRAINEIDRQKRILREKSQQKKDASQKIRNVYDKLQIQEGKKEQVWQLTEQLDVYKIAKENYTVTERLLLEKKAQMCNHSLFALRKEDINTLTLDQAIIQNKNFENETEKFSQANNEIIKIETNISREREGNDLEAALLTREESLDDLNGLYENNLSSITGKLIVDLLKNETREKNRPKVFKRANELFNRITKGQYELRLEEKALPAFKAYDTILRIGQDLDKLSTGTRIQLLLSVRLAFIETQEAAVKLPILADELLANSDDTRAKAIIEALVEISKEGRQVFYFTAQADEVIKWKSYLDVTGNISYEIKDLNGKQNETMLYQSKDTDFSFLNFLQNIPVPTDKSHEEYRKILHVSPFNFLTEELEQLHLWYIIEDNGLLYNCLSKGINYWGQLNSFLKYSGIIEGFNDITILPLQNKMKFLCRFQELYRKGRSRPITRQILEESGAVSTSFIGEVSAKLNELGGDPEKLIESLKKGGVSGFRSNKIEELEQYFISEGRIDIQDILEKETILVQLNAFLSNLELNISEAESCINRVLLGGLINPPNGFQNVTGNPITTLKLTDKKMN